MGYTATPFANIFVDPDAAHEQLGDDIFPRSFILNLQPPSNYIGPSEVFGLDADPDSGIEGREPIPLVRVVEDQEAYFPRKYGQDHDPGGLPPSLITAIRAFILICAARRPDLVLPRYRAVLFVHGCFWHYHEGCVAAVIPSSNRTFWKKKLIANQRRDETQIAALRAEGWRVGVFWECAARKGVADERTLRAVAVWLKQRSRYREFPAIPVRSRSRG